MFNQYTSPISNTASILDKDWAVRQPPLLFLIVISSFPHAILLESMKAQLEEENDKKKY